MFVHVTFGVKLKQQERERNCWSESLKAMERAGVKDIKLEGQNCDSKGSETEEQKDEMIYYRGSNR